MRRATFEQGLETVSDGGFWIEGRALQKCRAGSAWHGWGAAGSPLGQSGVGRGVRGKELTGGLQPQRPRCPEGGGPDGREGFVPRRGVTRRVGRLPSAAVLG